MQKVRGQPSWRSATQQTVDGPYVIVLPSQPAPRDPPADVFNAAECLERAGRVGLITTSCAALVIAALAALRLAGAL